MLHNDLIAPRGDTEIAFFHALALFTLPGFFFAYGALLRYVARGPGDPSLRAAWVVSDRGFLVALSMLALSFVAVWAWDELLPTRRDYAILTPLPVPIERLLAAKAVAVLALLAICAAAINLFSAFVFPMVGGPSNAGLGHLLQRFGAHAVVLTASSAFVGLASVAARALFVGPGAMRFAQLVAFLLLVQSMFLLPRYAAAMRALHADDSLLLLLPPTWFVGLYGTLAGSGRALDHGLAATALLALGASAASCLLSYRLAAQGNASPSAERAVKRNAWRPVERLLNRFALRSPGERAVFWFVLASLWRSQRHRLSLTAYGAVGLAVSGVIAALMNPGAPLDDRQAQSLLVRASFVLVFFLLLGLRSAFDVPAELSANWLFRLAGPRDAGALRGGVRKAALLVASTPVLVSLLPLAVLGFGAASLLGHLVYGIVVVAVSVELLFLRHRKIPFTCTYLPGKANLRLAWPLYLLAFFSYVTGAVALERSLLQEPARLALVVALGFAVAVLCRRRAARAVATEDALLYEEEPDSWLSLQLDA